LERKELSEDVELEDSVSLEAGPLNVSSTTNISIVLGRSK
jgi:hypothetical protein